MRFPAPRQHHRNPEGETEVSQEIDVRPDRLPVLRTVEQDRAQVREQRRPWVAMSLIVVAAAAERLAVHATGDERACLIATAAVGFVTAVVVGHWSRRRLMGRQLRRRFVAALWGGAGWLVYVAAAGLSWGTVAVLLAVGCALSLMFWAEHRIYGRPKTVSLSPVGDDDQFARRWKENLAAKGKALGGSRLTERETIRSGFRYTLELVPGEHTVDMVRGLEAKIISGLRLMPGQQVIVEEHPELPAPAALLTIITKSTIKADLPWPGPAGTWDAGRGSVVMGPFADGEGVALFSVYRRDGMFGGFVQGGIGSGKSRGIETIAMACASSVSHPTAVWFACGQDGASSPLLMRKADATATTPEDLLAMLDAAIEVGAINAAENRQHGRRGFHPTADRPGLLIIIDEFHNFLDVAELGPMAHRIQARMATIIRELRKAGVALILATQDPLLSSFGPGKRADVMRSNLLIGNGVMMRSESGQPKQVFRVNVDPRGFPDLPGYGYLARPFPGDRQAPFRFFYVNDEAIERWADSFAWRALSPLQQSAIARRAGDWYTRRGDLEAARQRKDAELLDLLRSGDFTPADRAEAVDEYDESPIPVNIPTFDEIMQDWQKAPAAQHEPTAEQRRPLTESQVHVLAAIKRGVAQPKEIIEVTEYSPAAVHAALSQLESRGLIHKPRTGRYRPVA